MLLKYTLLKNGRVAIDANGSPLEVCIRYADTCSR